MSDKLKRLTGKNPKDFEPVASHLINNADIELFAELVSQEDFLFDFVKQNVASRLNNVCDESNYLNLIGFLKYYSPSYEDFIVSNLVKYANEDLTDKMLELFASGTDDEKTYCAKFFSYIQDPLAIEFLKDNAYSQNPALSSNCASALAVFGDKTSLDEAIEKLKSDDEFEKLDAVRFLVSYGDKDSVSEIIKVMKHSSLAENMAGEVVYLMDLYSLIKDNMQDGLFVLNSIINGLGEILSLAQVFDFQLYDVFAYLLKGNISSEIAVVLLNAKEKFGVITENDEYLFDETNDVKREVQEIKTLLASVNKDNLISFVSKELREDSLFVFTALDFSNDTVIIRNMLAGSNPTVILKALEVLKRIDTVTQQDKEIALNSVLDENIKSIIRAI